MVLVEKTKINCILALNVIIAISLVQSNNDESEKSENAGPWRTRTSNNQEQHDYA